MIFVRMHVEQTSSYHVEVKYERHMYFIKNIKKTSSIKPARIRLFI